MRLEEILAVLLKRGIGRVGTWEIRGRKGITLGDPSKYFPHPTGPQYQIDITNGYDIELTDEEIQAIERRFGKIR